MNKNISQIFLATLAVLSIALGNIVIVHFVLASCPNVGTENRPCVEDAPYDNPCLVVVTMDDSGSSLTYSCKGGRLTISNIDHLKFDVNNSKIVAYDIVPCYVQSDCGEPFEVTDGTSKFGDATTTIGGITTVRRCSSNIIVDSVAIGSSAGACDEQ